MPKEWNDDEIKAEIAEAVRIAREDGILRSIRDLPNQLREAMGSGNPKPDSEPTEGNPPPPKEPKDSNATPKSKSLWWGEQK